MTTAGRVIKCKAAVAWEYGKPLVTEEIEVAPPEANEVRIKIVATAVCHTDLYHLFEGMETELFPTILGHEAAGIVESVGSGVTEFHPGDKVIPLFINQCRECRFCKSPKTNHCEKGENGGHAKLAFEKSRITCKGKKLMPFMAIGSFSEYILMNQTAVAKIDPAAPLDKVCLIGCAISTGFGAAVNTAKVEAGSTCAVFGLGAVGLAAVMGCKFAGAERIIAVDINPKKAEKAKVFGATDFVNPKDQNKPISEVLAEMTSGGVDYSFECVGNVEVMRSALESSSAAWGVSVIVGWTDRYDFAARPIQLISGRTWKGSLFGGFKGKDGVSEMVRAYLQKKIKVDEFITHTKTLPQINEAIELMKSGQSIRTVLNVSSD
ncbi:alcohol dehydrogenase 1 isoform X2 [Oryzias melastigma]|uniref:Alcohol dehydrogenase 1-like n=1 Tax=Oryzias melastigma TaxID=30732 RepID=A0A3B3BYY1_ORYME|nr:alcohol dehydrogenase 1 isoform X2 [Oryzias melastigma]